MKKLLAILLTILMILSLVACGAKEEAPAAKEEAPAAEEKTEEKKEEAAAPAEEQITLKFPGWRTEDEAAINAMNEKFTAEYPNIKVVYEPVTATEYDTNLQTSLSNGTAADIIKIAMNRIYRRFDRDGIRSKMLLQVHDELNFDVVPGEEDSVARIVKEEMEAAFSGTVPLVADCGSGANWLEAH